MGDIKCGERGGGAVKSPFVVSLSNHEEGLRQAQAERGLEGEWTLGRVCGCRVVAGNGVVLTTDSW